MTLSHPLSWLYCCNHAVIMILIHENNTTTHQYMYFFLNIYKYHLLALWTESICYNFSLVSASEMSLYIQNNTITIRNLYWTLSLLSLTFDLTKQRDGSWPSPSLWMYKTVQFESWTLNVGVGQDPSYCPDEDVSWSGCQHAGCQSVQLNLDSTWANEADVGKCCF